MRNPAFHDLAPSYIFGDVTRRVEAHPNPVDLGVGDTSLPLADCIVETLRKEAPHSLRYGPEHGLPSLRAKIAESFYPMLSADEIFISDGVKTDIGRIQALFHSDITIGLQDPTYPTYREAAILSGKKKFCWVPCIPENGFFPDSLPKFDLLILCSPNNPTGHALNRSQLTQLIELAHAQKFLILYDTAYAHFITDPTLPRTPYEIPGAENVVIELNSFSKLAGFTGLRLGWSVVPKALTYPQGGSIHADWRRVISTYYNGNSRLAQAAGLAALTVEGKKAIQEQTALYLRRAKRLKEGLSSHFSTIYGGDYSPYLWIPTPSSFFDQRGIITIAGEGFGPSGKGYVRLSAFGSDETIDEALVRCMP